MWEDIKAWFKKNWTIVKTVFRIAVVAISVIWLIPVFTSSSDAKKDLREKKRDIKKLKAENKKILEEIAARRAAAKKKAAEIKADKEERDKKASKYFPGLVVLLAGAALLQPTTADAQETFDLETSKGTVELHMPAQEDLRGAYIDMAGLYIEERYDVEELLEENDKLIADNERLEEQLKKTEEELEETKEIADELRKQINPVFRSGVGFGVGVVLPQEVSPQIWYGIVLFNRVQVNVYAKYPFEIGLQTGIIW